MDSQDTFAPGYPARWEADVILRDGLTAHLRPITPDDAEALQSFHVAQSEHSQYLRFFAPMARLSRSDLERFTHVDYKDRVALIVTIGDDIIGVARYDRLNEDGESGNEAEVAFNIADSHQGRGIGSVLLEHLAAAAREQGVTRFVAEVLPGNAKMLNVFAEAGYEVSEDVDDGIVSVDFDIDPTRRSLEVTAAREQRAEARSIDRILRPRSLAVLGVRAEHASLGSRVIENLRDSGYSGRVVLVGEPLSAPIGMEVCPDAEYIDGPIDIAILTEPMGATAEDAERLIRRCAEISVRGLVLMYPGAEHMDPNLDGERGRLVRLAHSLGMRIVGPASFGFLVADAEVSLNATALGAVPPSGKLGLFTQSVAMSVAALATATRRNVGLSSFLSAGRRADVSGNDLMQYWQSDDSTKAVALYLETVGNPRKFYRIARRLSRNKPVIVVNSGSAGRQGVDALDEVLRQAGVIGAANLHEMFDVAQLFLHQPLPAGGRIGIVSNSPSLSALVAQSVLGWGLRLDVDPVSVDDVAGGGFEEALSTVFACEDVDAVVAAFIPEPSTPDADVAKVLAQVAASSGKTTVACFLGMHGVRDGLADIGPDGQTRTVPAYASPEDAVLAVAAAVRYARWKNTDYGPLLDPGRDEQRAREIVGGHSKPELAGRLDDAEAAELLECYGIYVWPSVKVRTAEAAIEAAESLGWPVAVKTTDDQRRHRIDLGGIRLDVSDAQELANDVAEMLPQHEELVVQSMADAGVSCVVRATVDPLLGPVISFGLSGDAIELLGDVAHRIPPLTGRDVAELVRSVKASPRLFGYRGLPAMDVAALEDLVMRVGVLADDLPEVHSLELNPVIVSEHGVSVLSARAVVGPGERADESRRVLGLGLHGHATRPVLGESERHWEDGRHG